jgi:hypothetical protein
MRQGDRRDIYVSKYTDLSREKMAEKDILYKRVKCYKVVYITL